MPTATGAVAARLNHFVPPPTLLDRANMMTYRRRHPGGARFCFADGSVRFVHKDNDDNLYRAHSNRRVAN